MTFHIVCTKERWTMAVCDTRERAETYLDQILPDYIRRGFLIDKTLTANDFEIEERKADRK